MKIHSRSEDRERQSANISGQLGRLRDQLIALFIDYLLGWGLPIRKFLTRFRVDHRVSELFNWRTADDEGPPAARDPALRRDGFLFGKLQSGLKRADNDQHCVFGVGVQ